MARAPADNRGMTPPSSADSPRHSSSSPTSSATPTAAPDPQHRFDDVERAAVYRAIALRRDMRHFTPSAPLPDEQFERLLQAAHAAPSVGLMQPWRFMRLSTTAWRERLMPIVEAERRRTAQALGEAARSSCGSRSKACATAPNCWPSCWRRTTAPSSAA